MSDSRRWKKAAAACAVALALLLGTVSLVWAQGAGSASITGTVKDPKGLLVPDAQVVVHNADTGADRNLTTNKDGLYVAPLLQPGHYEVRVRKEGFAEVVRKDLLLEVGQALTVDIDLPLKATQQTVTVTAEAGRVETEKGDVSATLNQAQLENLPLANRRWDILVLQTPGVATDGGFGLISFRGISGLYNNNMVDGADNNQAFFSEARGRTRLPYGYSMDAVKEFNVTNAAYSAEYGRAAGGVVNAITKSGTNDIHGDAYWLIRDDLWLARDPFANSSGQPKPDDRRQYFGGGIGGPIVQNKLFFYVNYDQFKHNFPAVVTPPGLNFFDTTSTNSQAQVCESTGGPGVTACQQVINALQPLFFQLQPRHADNYIGLGKMDYQINANNRISGVFNILRWDSPNGIQTQPTINVSQLANGPDLVHNQFITLNWNSVLKPTVVNEVRFQYGEDFEFESANHSGPAISISDGADLGMPSFLPRPAFPDEKRSQWVDNLSWVHGRHETKMGFDINYIRDQIENLFGGGGSYNYSGGSALRNLVIDLNSEGTSRNYNSFTQAVDPITGSGRGFFSTDDVSFYAQDNFKWRPNFTLNMGLRYEVQVMPGIARANPLLPESGRLNTDLNNFGPRVGFAWDIRGNQTQVIRAGYGIYYGRTENSTIFTHLFQNGIFQQTFSVRPSLGAACAPIFPNTLFPQPAQAPAFSPVFGTSGPTPRAMYPTLAAFKAACPAASGALTVDVLDPSFVNPLVHEYDATYERTLPGKFDLTVSYLGSRANHLPIFYDVNLFPPNTTATYLIYNGAAQQVGQVTVPFFSNRARPRPGLGTVLMGKSIVNSWYNGLVIRFRRRVAQGFSFDGNFTYAKSIDDGAVSGTFGTFTGTDVPLNPFDIRGEYGLSDLDIRKRFVMNFNWDSPFGNWTQNQAAKAIIGGWGFSGIITAQDGRPVTANMSGSPSCASRDFGVTCGEVSNNAGFTSGRTPFITRNAQFVSPGLFTVDFRVSRDFKVTERMSFQIIGEAFNLFNRANVLGVRNPAYDFVSAGRSFGSVACPSASTGINGCLAQRALPRTAANSAFLAISSTSNTLYGARQMQFGARFRF